MLKIGQVIMYRRSACTVDSIIENYRENGMYYKLTPCYDTTLVIRAPIDCPEGIFKPLLTPQEVDSLMNDMSSIASVNTTDTSLENTYKELFESEKHEDLIRIIKTAYSRKEAAPQKGLKRSEKDKLYLQKAEKALYGELAIVLNKTVEDTRSFVTDRLSAVTA